MSKNLIYLTYQTFPAPTANTIQTIDNVKYLFNKGYKVQVVFPMRSRLSSDKSEDLKNYYEFNEEIEFKGLEHKLPFGKYKIFEKYFFIISHFKISVRFFSVYQRMLLFYHDIYKNLCQNILRLYFFP